VLREAGARGRDVSLIARQANRNCGWRALRLQTRADRTEPARMLTSRIRCCVLGRKDDEWLPNSPWSVNA
jgi:hypothetical protein